MDEIKKDKRFSHITKDPKFRKLSRNERKVQIDKRFHGMFKEKKFKESCSVDKKGRPIRLTSDDHLRHYYDLSDEENLDNNDHKDNDLEDLPKPDYARGEIIINTDSGSSDDEFEFQEEKFDHKWNELDNNVTRSDKITKRFAVCNQNWDRIKADDLFAAFNSFKPTTGVILSVKIYPSKYGLERLKEEEKKGPQELIEKNLSGEERLSKSCNNTEGEEYHREKLREYQLNRLKYYYAIVDCDSAETANSIYEECDSVEFEASATQFDLRFVPDDMEFTEEPKDVANQINLLNYKPTLFKTSALTKTNVELTWDETDHKRVEMLHKNFKKDNLEELDLKDYLASSNDDSLENDSNVSNENIDIVEKKHNKYKELLEAVESEEKEDINDNKEITWDPGLKEKTEELVKNSIKEKTLTPFEKYLDKKKEKKSKKWKKNTEEIQIPFEDSYAAFSDDEVDVGNVNDTNKIINNKKRKKTKKEVPKLSKTEEEHLKKNLAELSMLMDDNDDKQKHFNLEAIQKNEKKLNKRQKRKLAKMAVDNQKLQNELQDDFEINIHDDRFQDLYKNPQFNIDPSAPQFKKTKNMKKLLDEKINRSNRNSNVVASKKNQDDVKTLIKSIEMKTKNNKKAKLKR